MEIIAPGDKRHLDDIVRLCASEIGRGQPEWPWEAYVRTMTFPSYEDSALLLFDGDTLAGFALYHQLSGALAPVRWYCQAHLALTGAYGERWQGAAEKMHAIFEDTSEFEHGFTRVSGRDFYLLEFVIAPQYRWKGYGARLLDAVCERLAGRGAEQLFLHSTEMDRGLYEKAGFEPILHLERSNGRSTRFMGKKLS